MNFKLSKFYLGSFLLYLTAAITKLITKGDRFKLLVRATISSVIFESTKTCFKPPAAPLIKSTTAIFLMMVLNYKIKTL